MRTSRFDSLMLAQGKETRAHHSPLYALETLHAMPCGCVAAVYRTRPWDFEVVALEARGPHCLHVQHETGHLLGLGAVDGDRFNK